MKVVHINTFDQLGGAARAAYRLHTGLRTLGVDSLMYVLNKDGHDPLVLRYEPPMDLWHRISRIARRELILRSNRRYHGPVTVGLGNFSDDRSIYANDPWRCLPRHDLFHLHWITAFMDYTAFFASLPRGTPVVWTLHDMAPFTGGCHWNQDCPKFAQECGACPQLGSHNLTDWTRKIWQRKRKSLEKIPSHQLHVVTPSQWLQQERKRSSLFSRFSGSVIPNGLDTDAFSPRDRSAARNLLGVPLDAKVVLFLADSVTIPRKGSHILVEALAGIDSAQKPVLLSLGSGGLSLPNTLPHIHVGSVHNDRILSHAYSAADVFVAPSLQDNLPNTILESLACGTPVVAFDVGGIPDAVKPGRTGLLAKPGDSASLKAAIMDVLSNDDMRREMSSNCREVALKEYSVRLQAQRYLELYRRVLHLLEGQSPQKGIGC